MFPPPRDNFRVSEIVNKMKSPSISLSQLVLNVLQLYHFLCWWSLWSCWRSRQHKRTHNLSYFGSCYGYPRIPRTETWMKTWAFHVMIMTVFQINRERIMASSKERPVNDCFVFVHAEKFISTTSSQAFLLQIGKKQLTISFLVNTRLKIRKSEASQFFKVNCLYLT